MRRFGLYNAVKQGKMTSEPGASNETIVTEAARHEEAASRIPDAVPDEPRGSE